MVIALQICMIQLLIVWVLPLYMLCFLLMFIVPAFVIRKKLNRRLNTRHINERAIAMKPTVFHIPSLTVSISVKIINKWKTKKSPPKRAWLSSRR